tara:strand:+ start:337 stop:909 length:573 start_codon:yes stop_codon:yes gene_type:complete
MSNELGATKINELINTADTTDNEDDVVSNILNELEGTNDDDDVIMNETPIEDLSNNQDDLEEIDDSLFNADNNIFNTDHGDSDKVNSNTNFALNNDDNKLVDDSSSLDSNNMDVSSFLPEGLGEILDLIKYPLIVIVIVLLINNEFVVKHLSQIKFFITDEKINMYAYILQAVLSGLILLSIIYIIKVCS